MLWGFRIERDLNNLERVTVYTSTQILLLLLQPTIQKICFSCKFLLQVFQLVQSKHQRSPSHKDLSTDLLSSFRRSSSLNLSTEFNFSQSGLMSFSKNRFSIC